MSHSNTTAESARPPVKPVDLTAARQMLPLVQAIVRDIVGNKRHLDALSAEQATLDSFRRELTWVSRSRRYAVTEEVAQVESSLHTAVNELAALGVALVDADAGAVDFPTKINDKPAAFSWQLGDEGVSYWRYNGENQRRPIPADWSGTPLRVRGHR